MIPPAPVGRTAFLLGFAGLLPQIAAVLILLLGSPLFQLYQGGLPVIVLVPLVALTYAGLILSFLGGTWWGFAVRSADGQGRTVALAVLPSLTAWVVGSGVTGLSVEVQLLLMGVAIIATLPVDWYLSLQGMAPANWLRLRVPLSLGLGGLTCLLSTLTVEPIITGLTTR